MAILVLLRGLPGSGKTTFAVMFGRLPYSADDYFTSPAGEYKFNKCLLPQAHDHCKGRVRAALANGHQTVVVANTFSERWELEPYLAMAPTDGPHEVRVVDLFDGGLTDEALCARGRHGVSLATIAAMRQRWEHSWGQGNPLPPWQR